MQEWNHPKELHFYLSIPDINIRIAEDRLEIKAVQFNAFVQTATKLRLSDPKSLEKALAIIAEGFAQSQSGEVVTSVSVTSLTTS